MTTQLPLWSSTITIAGAVLAAGATWSGLVVAQVRGGGTVRSSVSGPAGLGDIAVGVAAPWVARAVSRAGRAARRTAVLWNLLGILDLVVAVSLGVLTTPGPQQVFAHAQPNLAITAFPLVLVPAFAVP